MLRFLIATGVTLMLLGFGAAGWQYWQSLPDAPAVEMVAETGTPPPASAARTAAALPQSWPISPTGGAVAVTDVRAFLDQDRSEPARSAVITLTATLDDLLAEGEVPPEPVFSEVFGDIRAPLLADGLCPVLTKGTARLCVVHSARVVPGSVDLARGTARFRIELYYGLGPDAGALPDLALHVLDQEPVTIAPENATGHASVEAALAALIDAATAACPAEEAGQACRVLRLSLDWAPGQTASGQAQVSWLRPLPKSLRVAPPIDPSPEG
ncbi:hypothetical protein MCELHM10_03722 [Paracoccaceae bacterium]|jgi:hypothetical protein